MCSRIREFGFKIFRFPHIPARLMLIPLVRSRERESQSAASHSPPRG
jgi:hypothetical protein